LLLPPQPHSDSDLDDETPPRTIGAAAAYRCRNGDEAVVNPPLTLLNEVPNCRPWPNFRLERLYRWDDGQRCKKSHDLQNCMEKKRTGEDILLTTNRLCVCVQAPGEGRERAIPLLGSIATVVEGL
jgi:hypothetical protein